MNVFDVLRERLEESQERYDDVAFAEMNENGHTLDFEYANGKKDGVSESIEIVNQVEQEYNSGWIPSEQPPKDDKPVLLSFANFSVPLVGRYEEDENGGAYYVGNVPLVQQDIFVNAWQPLPPKYEPKGE